MPIATATMMMPPPPSSKWRHQQQQYQPGPSVNQRAIDTESPPPDPDDRVFTLDQVYDPTIRCIYDVGDYLGKV